MMKYSKIEEVFKSRRINIDGASREIYTEDANEDGFCGVLGISILIAFL